MIATLPAVPGHCGHNLASSFLDATCTLYHASAASLPVWFLNPSNEPVFPQSSLLQAKKKKSVCILFRILQIPIKTFRIVSL
jgi:P pilus assembly chaperone PapD